MASETAGNLGLTNKKIGMLIFLASEIMFFTGLLGAYMVLRHTAKTWPRVSELVNFHLAFFSTALLISSSFIFMSGLKRAQDADIQGAKKAWKLVSVIGVLFLELQFLAWRELASVKNIRFSTNLFGAWFYALNALHAFHLAAGIFCLIWFMSKSKSLDSFEALGLYWHFVSGVWGVIFMTLYVIG